MDPLALRIFSYPDLSDADRAELERRVAADPARAALLAEVRTLYALLAEARADRRVDAQAVADYVVARALGTDTPADLEAYDRVEAALEARPELMKQARKFHQTLQQVTARAESPVAQFERLTGRSLDARVAEPATIYQTDRSPAAPRRGDRRPAPAPARPAARRPFLYRALAGVAVAGALYAALFVAGPLAAPEGQRRADLATVEDSYGGLTFRGGPPDPTVERYAAALARLEAARHTTLGLFPRYDAAELEAVATDLTALAGTNPEGWERLEAARVVGLIRLHQGRFSEAATAFRQVIAGEGPHADEARQLLSWLEATHQAD